MRKLVRQTVDRYLRAWATQDREGAEEELAPDLDFRSPQDRFSGADAFLAECWKYAMGLTDVKILESVYDESSAFLLLEWHTAHGPYCSAEYYVLRQGKICKILVTNNDPDFKNWCR